MTLNLNTGAEGGAVSAPETGEERAYRTYSEAETEAVGEALARSLQPGAVLAFRGGLGMGKTAFTRGLARGLGYPGRVTSPTFTIVNEYLGGRLPLFHFDLYRLEDAAALWDLGWDDYLDRGGVCAVEWSERAEELLPPGTLQVDLARDGDGRRIVISGILERGAER